MGNGLPDAKGIADRKHDVADLQFIGIGKIERREFLAGIFQAQHSEIGARILQHDLDVELALVAERHLGFARALDHVVVGDHEAAGIDDDPGAERALHLLTGQARVRSAEKPPEERIIEERRAVLDHLGRIDVDHGRGHPLDDRGIGQREFGGRAGHPALLTGGEADESEQEERRKRDCAQA